MRVGISIPGVKKNIRKIAICESTIKKKKKKKGNDEPHIGTCLNMLGIYPGNTLDRKLRQRFMVFAYKDHFNIKRPDDASKKELSFFFKFTHCHKQNQTSFQKIKMKQIKIKNLKNKKQKKWYFCMFCFVFCFCFKKVGFGKVNQPMSARVKNVA